MPSFFTTWLDRCWQYKVVNLKMYACFACTRDNWERFGHVIFAFPALAIVCDQLYVTWTKTIKNEYQCIIVHDMIHAKSRLLGGMYKIACPKYVCSSIRLAQPCPKYASDCLSHTHTHTHTRAHTRARTHARAHTHTHTHQKVYQYKHVRLHHNLQAKLTVTIQWHTYRETIKPGIRNNVNANSIDSIGCWTCAAGPGPGRQMLVRNISRTIGYYPHTRTM